MERILKAMEDAAGKKILEDVALGSFQRGGILHAQDSAIGKIGDEYQETKTTGNAVKGEKKLWTERKEKRKQQHGDEDNHRESVSVAGLETKRMKIELGPNEGHYQKGSITYLEGSVYSVIFEEDMPVQIWTGSKTMTDEYRKSDEAQNMWKMGLILKVYKDKGGDVNQSAMNILFDVSYLNSPDDADETIEHRVEGQRLRLILGSDDSIPSTIEEARLSLMGGEEIITMNHGQDTEVDENTGLSKWGTVSVRKVTVSQEVKEERSRARLRRQEEAEREKRKESEMQARISEEARHSNLDDSALGAYNAWEISGGKSGYKGVQIDAGPKLDGAESARSLANGKVDVKFKTSGKCSASSIKRAKLKQNRRKTFADDDGDD